VVTFNPDAAAATEKPSMTGKQRDRKKNKGTEAPPQVRSVIAADTAPSRLPITSRITFP
jgi:hypothetical protein